MKKHILILLIFTICADIKAQEFQLKPNHSNFLYRYIDNPISITSNPKDSLGVISLTLNTPSLHKLISGEFIVTPISDYKTSILTAVAKDINGKARVNRFELILRDIPPVLSHINGKTFLSLESSELETIKLEAGIPDFLYPLVFEVMDFELKIPNQKPIRIEGNSIPKEIIGKIKKIKKGEYISLQNINILAVEGFHGEDKNFNCYNPVVIEIK